MISVNGKDEPSGLIMALSKINGVSYPASRAVSSCFQFQRYDVLVFKVHRPYQRNDRRTLKVVDYCSYLNTITTSTPSAANQNDIQQLLRVISNVNSKPSNNYSNLLQTYQTLFPSASRPTPKTASKSTNVGAVQTPVAPVPDISLLVTTLADINIPPPPPTFECLVCFESYPLDEGRLFCSSILQNGIQNDTHTLCIPCIRRYAQSTRFDGQVRKFCIYKYILLKLCFRLQLVELV